jgi:hypothetical protein
MKKALIITYYWPPSGGAGVQRWLKFAKYLRDFGWEPIIYTPENPESPVIDPSLEKDIPEGITILKTKIFEPYTAYKRFVGRKKSDSIKAGFLSEKKNPSLAEKISVWIRGNFFIPDARTFWIKPSIRFLTNYLKTNPVDAIISTGPPHSMHMIALGVKKATNLPWLADFRDPWTNIDFYDELMLTGWADRKHKMQELQVLQNADVVVTISKGMSAVFDKLYHREYEVITNGFDDEDLADVQPVRGSKFCLAHVGSLVKSRNPEALWKVLKLMTERDKNFAHDLEIRLIGNVDWTVRESLSNYNLNDFVKNIDYLPHEMAVNELVNSEVLLLLINRTPNAKMILTGKFFEYLAARRPILCIGPEDGDAASVIKQTTSGMIAGFSDEHKIREHLVILYNEFKKQKPFSPKESIQQFSRRNLAKRLAGVLNGITDKD